MEHILHRHESDLTKLSDSTGTFLNKILIVEAINFFFLMH